MYDYKQWEIIAEILIAALLGGIIGFEREQLNKPAGLRTHMLVAAAATLLVGLSDAMLMKFHMQSGSSQGDPVRIVEAIITGISFLGAGTIFQAKRSEKVHGLTTAASILMSAAIGVAVALKQIFLASAVTVMVFVILRVLTHFEAKISGDK